MKIKVLSSKQIITDEKGKEKTFYRYFTPVEIEVIDSDGASLGIQKKNLQVHFTKVASKKLKDEKVFSIITSKGEDVGFPFQYHIPKDKTDEDEYAKNHVWIRDIISEEPIPFEPKQSSKNTCTFLVDEEETDSVEIVEEN